MSLTLPPLDDLNAEDLVKTAQQRLAERGASWVPSDPADPGLMLLEAFAQVTREELLRLARVPTAMQTQYLSLLGAHLKPGIASHADVEFHLSAPRTEPTLVPAGLRISQSKQPERIFVLLDDVILAPDTLSASGVVAEVTRIIEDTVGPIEGVPGARISLAHDGLAGGPKAATHVDVLVNWPLGAPLPPEAEVLSHQSGPCVRYTEVDQIERDETRAVFAVKRAAGLLSFPSSGPFMPPKGTRIIASYCALAGTPDQEAGLDKLSLDDVLDPLPGVEVRNPSPGTPGLAAESIEARLARGPLVGLDVHQAVRARDFEEVARDAHPAVVRAHALSMNETWAFAPPGTVQVLVSLHADLRSAQLAAECQEAVRQKLEAAAPLGVHINVAWLQVKYISVALDVYASAGRDAPDIETDVARALDHLLSPEPAPLGAEGWPNGWPLGRSLRKSEVIEAVLAVPGVRAVDKVVLRPRYPMEGPVAAIAPDCVQAGAWFVVMGASLYQTVSGGDGWTRVTFDEKAPDRSDGAATSMADPEILSVACHPKRTGWLGVALADGRVLVSRDCGHSFTDFARFEPAARPTSMLWADGSETPRLLISSPNMDLSETSGPEADGAVPALRPLLASDGMNIGPSYAMASHADGRAGRLVAAARARLCGVVLSNDSGWDGGWRPIGLEGHDVRALCFLQLDARVWLLAGCANPMTPDTSVLMYAEIDPDTGALIGPEDAPTFQTACADWAGGSVLDLAVEDDRIFAATLTQGLVEGRFTPDAQMPVVWDKPSASRGLPQRASGTGPAGMTCVCFAPKPPEATHAPIIVGGDGHLLRAATCDAQFEAVAAQVGADRIRIPADWVIGPDPHEIEVHDATA